MATEPTPKEEAMLYGGRFLTEDAPDGPFPQTGMAALDAQRLVEEELQLEGDPNRNLATFVTTSMEPEAKQLIYDNNYRNFIDHESLVVSHSVDPGITGVVSGVRWYDFRISGQPDAVCSSYPCTYQQGTIADAPNGRRDCVGNTGWRGRIDGIRVPGRSDSAGV